MGTVMLLDRCLVAKQQSEWKTEQSPQQRAVFGKDRNCRTVLLAATLLSMKASLDLESLPSGAGFADVINHLSRRQVEFQDVIAAELDIIKELHSSLGAPTALSLLNALGRRIAPSPQCRRLANFLLHLSVS